MLSMCKLKSRTASSEKSLRRRVFTVCLPRGINELMSDGMSTCRKWGICPAAAGDMSGQFCQGIIFYQATGADSVPQCSVISMRISDVITSCDAWLSCGALCKEAGVQHGEEVRQSDCSHLSSNTRAHSIQFKPQNPSV